VYLRQRYNGIEVYDANINANVARDGSIISLDSSFVRGLAAKVKGKLVLNAEASIQAAARQLGIRAPGQLKVRNVAGGADREVTFAGSGISLEPIPTKLVYQPVKGGNLRLARQVELYELDGDHWWNLRVDATTGRILARTDYVNHADDEYRVYAIPKESPNDGRRTLEINPASGASPNGWHNTDSDAARETTNTTGNNVNAYADRDNNNAPDPGSSPDGELDRRGNLTFDFSLDLDDRPADYQDAAVTNLFYWNNVIHDVLYGYGFDEPSGNFQLTNFAAGAGKGGDPVRAEAQDGSGRNNANFATPPDGFSPRMQMFEWRSSAPNPIEVNTGPLAGNTYFGPMAGFGESLVTTGPITGDVVHVGRGCDPDYPIGNVPPIPDDPYLADPEGKIALIDRGTCTFVSKVKKAQDEGALMVIVANNSPAPPIAMGGADPSITIPSVMISKADGDAWKAAGLPFNVTVSDGTGGAPDRDSDLDNGVITHEYGHGLSNRLTGGPGNVGCLQNAEQMGEGWSDLLALMLTAQSGDQATDARGVGAYVSFQGADGVGIRPTPYSTDEEINPSDYQDVIDTDGVTLSIPHGVGYVWASMYWEVYWNFVAEYGFNPDIYDGWETGGNNLALQLMVDGMKFQPCSPGFVQGRDAILRADTALTGGANQCLIWQGFAKRGLGASARQGSSNETGDGTAAFDLPAECQAGGLVVPIALPATLPESMGSGRLRPTRRHRLAGARRRSH
jgi:extracellular elastinolytic metalloproteinase